MNDLNVFGVDLAKNVFQVYAEDNQGNQLYNRRFSRNRFKEFMSNQKPSLIGMEACGTSHYWGRTLQAMGHEVKLINPRKVKAYVIRNKNDAKDAEGIYEATTSKKVLGTPVKTETQQHLTMLHRSRSLMVKRRTQLVNHIRSQLAEYGMVTRQGYTPLKHLVSELLGGEHIDLPPENLYVLSDLYEEWCGLDKRLLEYDRLVRQVAKRDKRAQKLMQLPGIGEITATAIVGKVDDFNAFKKARDFAAWLGLTPKEYSSANKRRLGGISKQGDRYIRTLLIHGARSSLRMVLQKEEVDTAYHRWCRQLVARVGQNKAVVALANKHARMIWAILSYDRDVDLNYAAQFMITELDNEIE